jgi:homocysteine S-methyltransferase
MPNAGYPTVRGNRTYYEGDPGYFSDQINELRELGVRILGGCCGTTPDHIREVSKKLRMPTAVRIAYHPEAAAKKTARPEVEDPFWTALCDPDRKPIAVELDPPENADVTKFMNGARELREYGADLITVADCPVARARVDSSLLSCKIRRELSMDAMPHMTCRDRNLNATQALLMGLCAEGINKVLVVTGDPIPAANRDEVKSVYNFNSRKLIKYVDGLNQTVLPNPFRVFAALNLNVRNIGVQMDIALKKEQNGALAFLTQPVLSPEALKNLQLARETLRGRILGGIMPVVSERNARFMNSEIAGITVDEKIIDLYRGADREKGENLAVEISTEIARQIAPYVDGFYIITPFGRTGLVVRIIDSIRKAGLA